MQKGKYQAKEYTRIFAYNLPKQDAQLSCLELQIYQHPNQIFHKK